MKQPEVVIIRTGVANIASVTAAFQRAGALVRLEDSPDAITHADHVVLPGVGAFAAGMERLHALALAQPLIERIAAGRPTLAICLGLQLLARSSDESPGVAGLGILDAHVTRFSGDAICIPQLGWNRVTAQPGCALLRDGYAYYANSYRLDAIPDGWSGALSTHGAPFVAAIERGAVLACQLHPELSGPWGAALLSRWLQTHA
jgi:imidazole glycerol-phosphate synthase subunit HisH